jgi:hypothetical protein
VKGSLTASARWVLGIGFSLHVGCSTAVDLAGKRCTAEGRCVDGYVCQSGICVTPGEMSVEETVDGATSPQDSGNGGAAFDDAGGAVSAGGAASKGSGGAAAASAGGAKVVGAGGAKVVGAGGAKVVGAGGAKVVGAGGAPVDPGGPPVLSAGGAPVDPGGPPVVHDGGAACSANSTVCGPACVDLDTDVENCGQCRHKCKGDEACQAGRCLKDGP